MKTTLIIFSKDRTLQLKSLLLSIKNNYDIPEENINIIYKNTISEISYKPLIQEFKAKFILQNDFLQDIKNVVYRTDSEYIQFMVDDLIIKNQISLELVESFLDSHDDVASFCFRMGKNIKCGQDPKFKKYDNNILTWETSKQLGKHWNYAWEVASSLYRKELILRYLLKCRYDKETFPNPFEDHFYQCMPNTKPQDFPVNIINNIRFLGKKKSIKIACFAKSCCFTQGVNLVADINDDRKQQFDPVILHRKMLAGYVIDYQSLKNVYPEQPNAGHIYFRLKKQN